MSTILGKLLSKRGCLQVLGLLFGLGVLVALGSAFMPTPGNASPAPPRPNAPNTQDGYAHFEPAGPLTLLVGQQFTVDLMVNSGSNNAAAAQSYLTFSNTILQNVLVGSGGCGTITNTFTVDSSTFETNLQNQICNGPGPCTFGSITADPGTIAFASGAFSNPAANGDFRVAQAAFCATAPGDTVLHWQFTPPDPVIRNSDIVDENSNSIADRTQYVDYVVHVVVPTPTPTETPVNINAFAHFEPAGPLTVVVGQQFTLDLMVDSGTNNVAAAQSYLTFTNSILQNVLVGSGGCGTITNTFTVDNTTFDTNLQNQICNGPGPCTYGSITADPGTIAYASGALSNPAANGDFRVARAAFCATAPGDAVLHWQFTPPDPVIRNSDIVDEFSMSVANRTFYNDYVVHVVTATPTSTPTNTPTFTPTPSARLVGHVTWQGRPAQPNALQQLPITLTLRLASGGPDNEFTGLTTNSSGNFTVTLGSLAPGTYNWRVKGPNGTPNTNTTPGFLANSGSVVLTSGTVNQEMGLMRAGDANNDNVVSSQDFTILKATFGKSVGQPGYDGRADFTGDTVISSQDFTLLKTNFGIAGAPPIGPAP